MQRAKIKKGQKINFPKLFKMFLIFKGGVNFLRFERIYAKNVSVFLICVLLFMSFAQVVFADAYGGQDQGASITVTKEGISGAVGGVQKSVVDDGDVKQVQKEAVKVKYDKDGDVKAVKIRLVEKEKIRSTSVGETSIDSGQYQNSDVTTTEGSAKINVNQGQAGYVSGAGVIKQKQVTVTKVKFTDEGVISSTKMKESATAKKK
jgi:hypothetical protein